MNCSQARRILYPEPAKSEVTTEHAAASQHARECPDCDAYFQEQRQWSQLLKEKAGKVFMGENELALGMTRHVLERMGEKRKTERS